MANKTDRRIERTQANIASAIRELIMEKDYDAITVTEIAHRAGIDRKTFYLHYPSKDALLQALEEQHAQTMLSALQESVQEDGNIQAEHICAAIDAVLEQDLDLHRCLAANPSYSFLVDKGKQIAKQAIIEGLRRIYDIDEEVLNLYAEFYASGLAATYVEWLRVGGSIDHAALTRIAVTSIHASIESLNFPRRVS